MNQRATIGGRLHISATFQTAGLVAIRYGPVTKMVTAVGQHDSNFLTRLRPPKTVETPNPGARSSRKPVATLFFARAAKLAERMSLLLPCRH